MSFLYQTQHLQTHVLGRPSHGYQMLVISIHSDEAVFAKYGQKLVSLINFGLNHLVT